MTREVSRCHIEIGQTRSFHGGEGSSEDIPIGSASGRSREDGLKETLPVLQFFSLVYPEAMRCMASESKARS
jgi:hypothetical protein